MPSDLAIGDAEIERLKNHLLQDFDEYASFYKARCGELIKDRTKKFRPIWTEYVSGSKNKREDHRWPGVFRRWLEGLEPDSSSPAFWKDEQDRIDCILRSGSDRSTGDYEILVALQQEYDPDEVTLHTRELYNYNIPEKVLLIWSTQKRSDITEIADEARRVPALAAARGVANIGNIHVLVANREIRDWWLGTRPDPPEPQFEYAAIESAWVAP